MDEMPDLAEKALNWEFPKLSKKYPTNASKNPKKPAESSKINKKPPINFIQSKKQLRFPYHFLFMGKH